MAGLDPSAAGDRKGVPVFDAFDLGDAGLGDSLSEPAPLAAGDDDGDCDSTALGGELTTGDVSSVIFATRGFQSEDGCNVVEDKQNRSSSCMRSSFEVRGDVKRRSGRGQELAWEEYDQQCLISKEKEGKCRQSKVGNVCVVFCPGCNIRHGCGLSLSASKANGVR